MNKRSVSVSVKMTAEDYALLTSAANKLWPKAILTRSSIVLGLAKIAAENILSKNKPAANRK